MRSIDIHAHIAPGKAVQLKDGQDWHGFTKVEQGGRHFLLRDSRRYGLHPNYLWTPEERIANMDSLNVDVHVLSTWVGLYNYDLPPEVGVATSRECNDYVAELSKRWPQRFAGLATLPMQDVNAAIAELERSVTQLGLKGAQINDHVNGRTLEEPEFLPFWQAVEQLGALIFFHQQGDDTIVKPRDNRGYGLDNAIGNLADRTVTFATLVFGGVMDKFPDLKICFAHGGGFICFGAGRMDRGWQVRSHARASMAQPPSKYLDRFYYDCLTHSEQVLRHMIDTVGADRIVLGSDWPYDMGIDQPVDWVNSLQSLTQDEKEAILWKNLEKLLGI
ncbi:MAG TPA: amidohydrolase family protein [Dehalococcoidia bacterium]|jgi:aminocarboxymuconate-semialdehyde decarboxylase|nr:amidohydrolase family protein [Dehalococcoidia bacterium]